MNPHERKQLISYLNRVAGLDETPYSEVQAKISKLFTGISASPVKSLPGSSIYRAVRADPQPTNVRRLSHPPAEYVKGYQRCNSDGKPMFYGSESPLTILMEIKAQVGEVIYLGTWITEKLFDMWLIPNIEVQNANTHSEVVLSVFDTWFATPVHATFSNRYKITAAIAEMLTTPPLGGVLYTSVAHREGSLNLALRPAIADDCLKLLRVSAIKIVQADDDQSKVSFQEIDFSDDFEADGTIKWLGKGRDYKGVNVQRNEHGVFEARDETGKKVDVF